MRRTMSVVGVIMIVVGVAFTVLSLLTYADKDDRQLAEHRLYDLRLSPEDEVRARDDLRGIQDRERLNISVAIGGTVAAVAGGAMVRTLRRGRPTPSLSR
ncbi:hypothetical protein EJC51_44185 [Streptomyces aquilus]|uniref:Uncharacterized protein n=1 Tax=Streptomyces aquilus TaxID=2548456 RepID=A0A3S9IDP2_9ACTN|nr:hypothetical protein [Streptomyces aquilus]AZP22469.1 hypothetical protein EJC51_44185 [Streptomyces aquilus]